MGIDRIGKGGAPPVHPDIRETESIERRGKVEKTFSVERPDATKPAQATQAAAPSEALARFQAGEIDVDGYVDLKIEEATRGLEGLSVTEIDDLKQIFREQLVTDPSLSDLVHAATGSLPKPPED